MVIVGAGMAGLVAGYELKRAGHTPIILEAQQRVGGRVYTLRQPFTDGLYAEVGAMRIPRAHKLTLEYIAKFGLKTNDFTMDNPNAYYYIGGQKMRIADGDRRSSPAGFRCLRGRDRVHGRAAVDEGHPATARPAGEGW